MPDKSDTSLSAAARNDEERVWPVTLRLRRSHWHLVEDTCDAVRRGGSRYRPEASAIVRGVLDAVLPVIVKLDYRPLAERTEGQDQVTSRTTVASFIKDMLSRRLLRR